MLQFAVHFKVYFLKTEKYIENTRLVSFDIKLTRQGFENSTCVLEVKPGKFDIKYCYMTGENPDWPNKDLCRQIVPIRRQNSLQSYNNTYYQLPLILTGVLHVA